MRRVPLIAAYLAAFFLFSAFDWPTADSGLASRFEDAAEEEQVRILGELSGSAAVVREVLVIALDSDNMPVRTAALRAAGRLQIPGAEGLLIDALGSPFRDERENAALGLGHLGDEATVPNLIRALGDVTAEVRIGAITALSNFESDEGVVAVIGLLDDPDLEVRIAAVRGLAQLNHSAALVPLVSIAEEEPELRRHVYESLGALGDHRAVPALVRGLSAEDLDARLAAVGALGRIGGPRAVRALSEITTNQQHQTQVAVINALAAAAPEDLLERLLPALRSPSLGAHAVRLIEARLDESDLDLLLNHFARLSPPAREATIELMERFGSPRHHAATNALYDEQPSDATARLLGYTRNEDALVVLLDHLDHETSNGALDGLVAYFEVTPGDSRSADVLLDHLRNEPNSYPRVLPLLGASGASRALPQILTYCHHDARPEKLAGYEALARMGQPAALPHLVEGLRENEGTVRQIAAEALATQGTQVEAEAITTDLLSDAPYDRVLGLEILTAILTRLPEDTQDELKPRLDTVSELLLATRNSDLFHALVPLLALTENADGLEQAAAEVPLRATAAMPSRHDAAPESRAEAAVWWLHRDVSGSALLNAIDNGSWNERVTASYRVAQLARTGAMDRTALAALCDQVEAANHMVRVNTLVALRHGGVECSSERRAQITSLTTANSEPLRAAAIAYLNRVLGAHFACDGVSPAFFERCDTPVDQAERETTTIRTLALNNTSPARERFIGLWLSDGSLLVTASDEAGVVHAPIAPAGPLMFFEPFDNSLRNP